MSFFRFGQSADLDIVLDGVAQRRVAEVKTEDGRKERLYLFYDGESVSGKVIITLRKPGARLEHQGIKIEFVGQIELLSGQPERNIFLSLVKELARPGDLQQNFSYTFEFKNVEKPYESYSSNNIRLRYFLRATVIRRLSDLVTNLDLAVHTLSHYPDANNSIKMEVGIEDSLHIEFEYNKAKYHLKDVIVGKIFFMLVRIKIKHMEVAIIKRETTDLGRNAYNDNETIAKYEIMDGAPVRGESIPIRVFLAGYDLTPTLRNINKRFSVRYLLHLALVDEEERRYFKQEEIILWRKDDRIPASGATNGAGGAPAPATPQEIIPIQRHLIEGNIQQRSAQTQPFSEPVTPSDLGDTEPEQQQQQQQVNTVADQLAETDLCNNNNNTATATDDPATTTATTDDSATTNDQSATTTTNDQNMDPATDDQDTATTDPGTATTDPGTATTDLATTDPATTEPGTATTDPGTTATDNAKSQQQQQKLEQSLQ